MSDKGDAAQHASTSASPQPRQPIKIDLSKEYRISHVLEGHSSDVRALSSFEQVDGFERFQSASRDETVRSWFRPIPKSGFGPPPTWYKWITLHGKRYQNAVASVNLSEDEGMTVMGGLDARILVYKLNFTGESQPKDLDEPIQIIQEHHDNVCHLSISSKDRTPEGAPRLLISASWDATSRVYALLPDAKIGHKWKALHFLKGHERSVLEAQVVSAEPGNERYLTVSADLKIRYWHADKVVKTFTGHADVIRSIALLPLDASKLDSNTTTSFATCSNDGTIKLWSLEDLAREETSSKDTSLATLIPRQKDGTPILDLIFSVRFAGTNENGDRLLISGGEGGRVYIWNVDTQEEVLQILQPVTTCWDVLFLPSSGDIVTADSDNKIRVYTQRNQKTGFMAAEHRQEQKAKGLQVELSREEIEEFNKQCDQLAQSRVRADIIASETDSGHDDNVIDGQRYDAVLKIDVSDDSEPLSLPINKGDDPRTKAKAFIQQYSLSERYEDDIVAFIQQVGPK
ncbi:WD40 repeat-like protein [Meira miltonrushii]|uniref:WD40 repeat-like protein n=1 Tax=Meira miltonrushii TaxID=1280837 RepID=A0A316VI93_9BASI|nr:WD40 repeat-like protein [Meira miltonrushii]PWN36043.1 WD40 repeat-like protein [Meira miltonrushii]